ncbi:ubiquitin-conjugating enzyme E2 S [Tritrichomonas musculus]|uniref:Ubiquitin-conjugating enzyme E2 S n=1 Tax=Tritrichomonas musculus TaxID=1915356 RepID=A0ABR2H070_9EUKA
MNTLRKDATKRLMNEMRKLQKNELPGIKVKINGDDLTQIQATIEGPENTPYEGGEFQIKLEITNEYPQKPPKGYFLTKIFHPNIHPETGAICLSLLSSDWTEDTKLDHLLLAIKCLLIEPNPESALNEDAGRLLLENYNNYFQKVKLMTQVYAMKSKPVSTIKKNISNSSKKKLKRL